MKKKLSDMTLEELWQLFPISLTEHQEVWKDWYAEEQQQLLSFLPETLHIEHIGSTAINGIWAKPIIDILIEVPLGTRLAGLKDLFLAQGYLCMSESENRLSFSKGYTEEGFAERVFHIHVRYDGDNDELYFRDYLNAHPQVAKEYEQLKLRLWKDFEHNRDGYTEAKTGFIRKWTAEARR